MAKRVIVIGSGIIGASIAYHLAKGGAEVTVLDAGEAGGVATRASWACSTTCCASRPRSVRA